MARRHRLLLWQLVQTLLDRLLTMLRPPVELVGQVEVGSVVRRELWGISDCKSRSLFLRLLHQPLAHHYTMWDIRPEVCVRIRCMQLLAASRKEEKR